MILPWIPWGRIRPRIITRFKRLHCINVATGRRAVWLRVG